MWPNACATRGTGTYPLGIESTPCPEISSDAGSGRFRLGQVQVIVKNAAKRAGLTVNFSPHWLRHASASHALDAGATLATVRDGLGHASAATTNHYLHAKPRDGLSRYLKV